MRAKKLTAALTAALTAVIPFSFGSIRMTELPAVCAENALYDSFILPENSGKAGKYDNGAADAGFRLKKEAGNELMPGTVRVTLFDCNTGKLIQAGLFEHHPWTFKVEYTIENTDEPGTWSGKHKEFKPDSNPCIFDFDLADCFIRSTDFQFYGAEQPEVTVYDNGSMDLVFNTKIRVSGNINSDYEFNIADAVTLHNWLLGKPDSGLKNWEQADFNLDSRLDVFDLCLMRKSLVSREENAPVSLSIVWTGGFFGMHKALKVYNKDDAYFIEYEDLNYGKGAVTIEISEQDHHDIMTLDYDTMIERYNISLKQAFSDDIYYSTVFTYADGSEVKTTANMASAVSRIEEAMRKNSADMT